MLNEKDENNMSFFFFASAKLAKIVYAPQNGDINRTFVAFKKN